jgi:hypothetical protein
MRNLLLVASVLAAFAASPAARAQSALPPELRPSMVLVQSDGAGPATPAPGSLDFDLLEAAKPPPDTGEDRVFRRRRSMLKIHQGVGLGLVALQLSTTAVGQLNYHDKFGSTANTDRFRISHATLAYTTLGVFAANGALALFSPDPPQKVRRGFDRMTLHKLGMFTAAAGMAGQAALGVWSSRREGYFDQEDFARAHLVLGYVTLAALATGFSALVF